MKTAIAYSFLAKAGMKLSRLSVILWSCNPSDPPEDPCIGCPIDFNLTDYEPAWSPDGQWIAFVHADSVAGRSGIY